MATTTPPSIVEMAVKIARDNEEKKRVEAEQAKARKQEEAELAKRLRITQLCNWVETDFAKAFPEDFELQVTIFEEESGLRQVDLESGFGTYRVNDLLVHRCESRGNSELRRIPDMPQHDYELWVYQLARNEFISIKIIPNASFLERLSEIVQDPLHLVSAKDAWEHYKLDSKNAQLDASPPRSNW